MKAQQRLEDEKSLRRTEGTKKKKICEKSRNAEERSQPRRHRSLKEKTAPKIAMGVSLCVLSPVLLILMAGAAEYRVINASEDRQCWSSDTAGDGGSSGFLLYSLYPMV